MPRGHTAYTYLLCADTPIGNPASPHGLARHYCGSTDNLERRIARDHRRALPTLTKRGTVRKSKAAHRGARLVAAWNAAKIPWRVARVWKGGRDLERRIKASHNLARYCPYCTGKRQRARDASWIIPWPCNVPMPTEMPF